MIGPAAKKLFVGKNGISPLNSVPRKNDQRRRFILDLSFPKGSSINDGINKDWYEGEEVKLEYPKVDDLVAMILKAKQDNPNQEVLIWKRDLKSCYRQFHLCPGSVHLVGYKINGKYWYDLVLAMGSSSSTQICQKITDMITDTFYNRFEGEVKNFLDNFFSAEVPDRAEYLYQKFQEWLELLGVEESFDKAVPPSTKVIVLGILFDTIKMMLSLPKEKKQELVRELHKWRNRKSCSLRQMQALVGKLNFASGVVRAGRVYMARLINTMRGRQKGDSSPIILSDTNLSDVQWWIEHIDMYNGIEMTSLMVNPHWKSVGSTWFSDSSGTGIGGWSEISGQYFHHSLSNEFCQKDINSLECLALLLCVRKWAEMHKGQRIVVSCDNQTTVAVINSGAAKNKFLQACLREIHHMCAMSSMEIKVVWISTKKNRIADTLSRWHLGDKYVREFKNLTQCRKVQEIRVCEEDLCFQFTKY